MKVLAFNASPLMERGNTALLLEPFLKGMIEEGCDIELFYSCKLSETLSRRQVLLDENARQVCSG
jgi:multimeric flavodoxin WrbA